ncbi:unnamed protein product [Rotaria sp. Silwood2]|nr:unnamed protein product [Rotaria sp. Silwood2]CAF4367672.1 unnamed protein product [Rotaria sp. Silwood2]
MNDSISELSTTTKTFLFGSGQLLSLNEFQIEKFPYLTALVSAGSCFDLIKDHRGYFLLDSRIDYQDFLFALDAASFHSVRQIFTKLPKNYNILSIIALLDFLTLGPKRNPTLEEINSSFFWNVKFGYKFNTYDFIHRSSDFQDMAVRFAFAIAKEEYDFTNHKTIDQIYWLIMFILSAYKFFETHIRYHIYKIAQNCFSIFCPSLLKCLYRLEQRIEKEIQCTTDNHFNCQEENNVFWNLNPYKISWEYDFETFNQICNIHYLGLISRRRIYNTMIFDWPWIRCSSYFDSSGINFLTMDKNFEPIRETILENMYKYLLDTLLQQLLVKTHDNKFKFNYFTEIKYKPILDDILNSNNVQVTIQESILSNISELIPKLEQHYTKLMKEIQDYEQNHEISNEHEIWNLFRNLIFASSRCKYRKTQYEALECEQTLNKLHEYERVIDEIRKTILHDLYNLFMNEIKIFVDRRKTIQKLLKRLSLKKELKIKVSKLNKIHQTTYYPPLPKVQCKYKTR